MVDTCTCIHTFMRACINTSSTCMHTYTHTHKCTVMQICSTYSSELSVRVFLNTYDAQCLWSRPMSVCVCVWSQTPKQVYHGIKDQKMNIYIYMVKKHTWPYMAFMCMFSFAYSNILSLVSATSWPGDIGCCGNWESRGGEGRESSLSFFSCGFLGKCIFASMHIGVGSGHICRKHRKLPLFLISGHGT